MPPSDHDIREIHLSLERQYARIQSILDRLTALESHLARITALESRTCNCSAASSAGSGGTDGSKLGTGSSTVTASPTSTPLSTSSAPTAKVVANQFCIHCHGRGYVGGEECDCVYVADASSDPVSAAIRDDPNRPAWLTDEMLPLPDGTERVYGHFGGAWAYPGEYFFQDKKWKPYAVKEAWFVGDRLLPVYHALKPQSFPATESVASAVEQGVSDVLAGRTTPVGETAWDRWSVLLHRLPRNAELKEHFNRFIASEVAAAKAEPAGETAEEVVQPPKEIARYADALRWTPTSRVYVDWNKTYYVYPSRLALLRTDTEPVNCVHPEEKVIEKGCALVPNVTAIKRERGEA